MKSEQQLIAVLKDEMSDYRFGHTLGVVAESERLARIHGVDATKARYAALLHDCTKELSVQEQLQILKECGILLEEGMLDCPQILHAVSGSARATRDFAAPPEVASAIRWHATGRSGMTPLDMVVYVADLTEPTRRFAHDADTVRLRTLAESSLEAAAAYEAQLTLEREGSRGRMIWHDTRETYEAYLPALEKFTENK